MELFNYGTSEGLHHSLVDAVSNISFFLFLLAVKQKLDPLDLFRLVLQSLLTASKIGTILILNTVRKIVYHFAFFISAHFHSQIFAI